MKKYIILPAAAVTAAIALIFGFTAPAKKMPCPKCYVMHPEILPLDASGNRTADAKKISQERTCGECHNTSFINTHNSHYNETAKIGCSECHVEGGIISLSRDNLNANGTLKKDRIKIRVPSDENCLRCHGVGGVRERAVFIPDEFPGVLSYTLDGKCFRVTCKTGEILSPENISDSLLNIRGRDKLNYPWDVHMQREVACVSCHFTRNDPRRGETRRSDQEHLANDPRKSYSIGKYLYIPDHNLVHADCRSCHTPEKKHDFLPYKTRHFAVLSCQSCHVPRLYGPALKSVDETVVTAKGTPLYRFRGIDGETGNLNTAYNEGYEPFLVSHDEMVPGAEEITGIKDGVSPVNIMVRWRWVDSNGKDVPFNTVKQVYMNGKIYNPDILKIFDSNVNGKLEESELILDSQVKSDFIKSQLAAIGVKDPAVKGENEVYRINHGIVHEKTIKADCLSCHSGSSRFDATVQLAAYAPYGSAVPGVESVKMGGLQFYLNSEMIQERDGSLRLVKDGAVARRYIFGYSSVTWINAAGFLIFLLSVAGAAGHGTLRYIAKKKSRPHDVKLVKHNVYPLYERIWHWGMALSVIILILTGMEIHYSGSFTLFGFDTTVDIHNAFALIVVINAGLSLFYHAATGEIKQYFRITKGFRGDVVVQAVYYLYGIFRGIGHPFEKSQERKLNPLQQITYVMLLNVLFPLQILTGIMMWLVSVWPAFSASAGGLTVIAPVHNLCAWFFISFLTIHLYLITTGHTVFSSIKAMWTGTEEIDESESADSSRVKLAGVGLPEIINNVKKLTGRGREDI